MRALPESAERLLRTMDSLPAAGRLVLAGGTGLALRIAHRASADLDFVFSSTKLPRRRIANLITALRRDHRVEVLPNIAAEQDFLDAGLELADYQQDFSVDGVKVTFFVPEPASLVESVATDRAIAGLARIRVATLDSLFAMKVVTLNQRITTRDLFDLYTMIERHGYTFANLVETATRFDCNADVIKARLLGATRRRDDPGVEAVTGEAPTFERLRAYFATAIDRLEQEQAQAAFAAGGKRRPPR